MGRARPLVAAATDTPTAQSGISTHLLPVGPDAEVDITEGTAAHPLGDAVLGDGGLHRPLCPTERKMDLTWPPT